MFKMSETMGYISCKLPLKAGEGHEVPPLTDEILTIDGFWGRNSQFSLRVWPLIS